MELRNSEKKAKAISGGSAAIVEFHSFIFFIPEFLSSIFIPLHYK
jgi:hypothetical protein